MINSTTGNDPKQPVAIFGILIVKFAINLSASILVLLMFGTAVGHRIENAGDASDSPAIQSVPESRQISDYFQPSIYFTNGKLRGYKLYPGAVPGLFDELGLERGDLVTAVDGQALTDPQKSFGLLKRMVSGQTVRVLLERQGLAREIEVNAHDISPVALAAQRVEPIHPISSIFRPQPYFEDGKQRGYHLYPGDDPEIFADLGLRSGDLLTEINGQPLDDAAISYELFKTLARGESVELTLERQGKTTSLEAQLD